MHWHIRLQEFGQRWKFWQFPNVGHSAQPPTTAVRLWMAGSFLAASLLFVVGCQRDTNVPSLQATAVEQGTNDKGSAQPTTRVLLAPQADGFFDCPMLSLNNLETFIAEVNERDIRKLKLKPYSWSG